MKVTALIPDELIEEVKKLTGEIKAGSVIALSPIFGELLQGVNKLEIWSLDKKLIEMSRALIIPNR